jgi:hypothetical protein
MNVHDIPPLVVEPDLKDKVVVIVGNGMSCMDLPRQVLLNPNFYVMIMNSGMHLFQHADMMMCTDGPWLSEYQRDLWQFKGGLIVVTRPNLVQVPDPRMRVIQRSPIASFRGDIFQNPRVLVEGHTSVSTCLSLAVLRGARRVLLSGVDLSPGPGGRRRASSPLVDTGSYERRYKVQMAHLTKQSVWVKLRGVDVINCSYPSPLTAYPMGDIKQEVERCL